MNKPSGVVTWILGSILIVVLLTVGGFAVHSADAVGDEQSAHARLEGHPRIVERVDGLREDIAELREQQREQTKLLRRIDRNTGP